MSEYDGSVVHHDLDQCIETVLSNGYVLLTDKEFTSAASQLLEIGRRTADEDNNSEPSPNDREWFNNAQWEEAEAVERRFKDIAVVEQARGRNV